MTAPKALSHEEVRTRIRLPKQSLFEESENAYDTHFSEDLFFGVNQHRFLSALQMGVKNDSPTANVSVIGLSGLYGFDILVDQVKRALAHKKHINEPFDWCYLYNFDDKKAPRIATFRKGEGRVFKKKISRFLSYLKKNIPEFMQGAEIQLIWYTAQSGFAKWDEYAREEVLEKIHALDVNVEVVEEETIFTAILREKLENECEQEGKPRERWEEKLSKKEREDIERKINDARDMYLAYVKQKNRKVDAVNEQIERTIQKRVHNRIAHFLETLEVRTLVIHPNTRAYLDALEEYAAEHYALFLQDENGQMEVPMPLYGQMNKHIQWDVNVYVDNTETEGVPIVADRITSGKHLFGGVELQAHGLMIHTDHTKCSAGMLARANGGYLILSARNILMLPYGWELLKQAIKSGELYHEKPWLENEALHPEPIPLNVRVILFGPRWLMQKLAVLDHEFPGLFNAHAELMPSVAITKEQLCAYGVWMDRFAKKAGLRKVSSDAKRKLLEDFVRRAGHQKKLSTDFETGRTVLKEAHLMAEGAGAGEIKGVHVRSALQKRFWRASYAYEERQKLVEEGTLLITLRGEEIGRINALTVAEYGEVLFGFPVKITARANPGKPDFANVHTDAGLSGKITKKADLTVINFLKRKFAKTTPLALDASYSFEQSYGMIEGDSASVAKCIVLVSEIARIPIAQSIAVTGSVNLHGEVQPVGGVNEKIEGFYDACKVGGLTGAQGVVIPYQNKVHLMLRDDIVHAVKDGKFHVWAIHTLEEGIELFTNMRAGEEIVSLGNIPYEKDTVYYKTMEQLDLFSKKSARFKEE